jgi:hypothetical protein
MHFYKYEEFIHNVHIYMIVQHYIHIAIDPNKYKGFKSLI